MSLAWEANMDKRPVLNLLNANPTKWSNTLKQFVGQLPTNCLSVFYHFVELALKRLTIARLLLTCVLIYLRQKMNVHLQ